MISLFLILFSFSLTVAAYSVFASFILLCREAREEEFTARREAVAFAKTFHPGRPSHQ